MSTVEIKRTTALYPNGVFVQWTISADEVGDHYVDLARSGSPEGPWEGIATGLKDGYNFVDLFQNQPPSPPSTDRENINVFSLSRTIYYQVTVVPPSGIANAFVSDPTPVEPYLDKRTRLLKRKLQRDQAVGYRRLNGIPLIVLKRRRWGDRCANCFDSVTKQTLLEHCTKCYGTSYTGGYWAPLLIRGRREAAVVQSQMTSHGDSDVQLADFNTLDYPLVEYKDVIVDLLRDNRYEVQRSHATELKGVPVHQKITASLIARDAIEYSIPVDPTATPPLY